jgi:peptidoglycan/LPS O-acetylase OafA/YrhL
VTARNPALDWLRSAAILMVLATHLANQFAAGTDLAKALSVGGRGVDLFFVLSGFLLGSQLFREANATGTVEVRRFWIRRWLRTLPAYYAVLFATFLQLAATGKAELIDWRYLLFLQNYFERRPFLGVTWSLCVEEHFYLVIGPAILLAIRFPKSVWLFAAIVFALVGCHIAGLYRHRPDYHIAETHVVFEQCLVGVLLAWLAVNRPNRWGRCLNFAWPLFVASAIAIAIAVVNRTVWEWWLPDWGTGGWALIFGCWIPLANAGIGRRIRWLEFVAVRAYSLYLVHIEAIVLAKKLPIASEAQFVVSIALAFALAEALHRAVERPFNRLRDRWKKGTVTF